MGSKERERAMTFGPEHYVPVLKVKQGEKRALGLVAPGVKARMTPLLEIVERKVDGTRPIGAHLDTAFKGLADALDGYARCFLDTREIADDGPAAAADVFSRGAAAGVVFSPVTGPRRTADVAAALAHRHGGLALRVTRNEFEGGGLGSDIRRFVQVHSLSYGDVDLVLDLGEVDALIPEGVAALTDAFLREIPEQLAWRTLTISASAFPASMGVVDRNSYAMVERSEWLAWRDGLFARRAELSRLPTFSDCGIQNPRGVEGYDPRTMPRSASVRYLADDAWLLMKGESTKRKPEREQYPDMAATLTLGALSAHFAGASHCDGCSSMAAAAGGAPRLGSAGAWRRLGTIHHLTSVVEDLAALPWP